MKESIDLLSFEIPTDSELKNIQINQGGHDMSICTNSNFVTGFMEEFRGSLFQSTYSKKPFDCYSTKTIGDFETELEEAFLGEKYDKKEDNFLICPSAFGRGKVVDKERGFANVVFASGIWLDFDGGDLKPPTLAKLFPKLRMIIYSSFSSTKASLRFRVYIPTDITMNPQQYGVITKALVRTIVASGYYKEKMKGKTKRHGLDMGKLHAVSLFYLPCQPKDPAGAYFNVFKGKGREPLVVQDWIEKYIAEEEANTFIETPIEDTQFGSPETYAYTPHEGSGIDQEAVEGACVDWQQCPPGKGNEEFFILGRKLERSRLRSIRDCIDFERTSSPCTFFG